MNTPGRRFNFRDVVLIADLFDQTASTAPIHQRLDLEMTDAGTLDRLRLAISELGLKIHHYRDPAALARCADQHRQDIVLSIYGGENSRNRMALVPAICETFGLKFIGPDVYGRIIAQDKEICKRLAADCGLRTPVWRVARDIHCLPSSFGLSFPVVVKPLLEGSSIGITQRNLVTSVHDAIEIGKELLLTLGAPILIEEFVPGREVAFSKIQHRDDGVWAFSEVIIESDPTFFEHRLFDVKEKQFRTPGRVVRNIDEALDGFDRERIERFLEIFGSYGYCRVDGRLASGKFSFIELTPDAWLGAGGQFAVGFLEKGWTYEAIIAAVLASAD